MKPRKNYRRLKLNCSEIWIKIKHFNLKSFDKFELRGNKIGCIISNWYHTLSYVHAYNIHIIHTYYCTYILLTINKVIVYCEYLTSNVVSSLIMGAPSIKKKRFCYLQSVENNRIILNELEE